MALISIFYAFVMNANRQLDCVGLKRNRRSSFLLTQSFENKLITRSANDLIMEFRSFLHYQVSPSTLY